MEAGNLRGSCAQDGYSDISFSEASKSIGLGGEQHAMRTSAAGETQEMDSANHGGKKQWPVMTPEEEDLITRLHHLLGERWELIAKRLPNRTAEEVERYWRMKENKIYKPVCARLSPSFKFTMDEPLEGRKPSQTGS